MSKHEFTAKIKIQTLVDEAQRELDSFGRSLQKTWQNGEPPKKVLREYEALKQRLASLRELSNKGVVNTSDIGRAETDYKGLKKSIHELLVEFSLFSAEQKRAMLGAEEQANIKARAQAIDKYTQAIEKNVETLKEKAELEQKAAELSGKKQVLTARADANKAGIRERLANLKSAGGPVVLSDDAKRYKENSAQEEDLKKRIAKTKSILQGKIDSGAKKDGKEVTRLVARLSELEKQLKSLDVITGKADYTKAVEEYENTIKTLEDELKSTSTELVQTNTSLEETEKQLSKLKTINPSDEFQKLKNTLKQLGVEGIDSVENLEELKEIVEELESGALQRVDSNLNKTVSSLKKVGDSADKTKESLEDANHVIKEQEEIASRQSALESRIKSFLGLAGASEVLKRAMRDAMATITELDATMTEMAVVTDLSVGDYWDQLPQYSKQASELGVSINSAYKAATLYYQQGLKGNEVTKISAETLKMAKIAGMDAAEATDKMTAALRGFNMELNEASAQKVSDVYSELAAITAADTKEIANAMTKTASIAHSAGMEFETTAAFLAQIVETTRESAETAGTAMKTVIARFQELKKDPADIGEVDGEIVDANQIETALRSVGVSLRDANGQFRELDDVFLELSSKWDGLDKNTQRYIATIAAGSRQQSRFIAMMSDYGRTQELVTAANNSAGASQKQFEKTLEGVDAKLEKLKNVWHEFTMGIMNSDLVKTGIDILTKFLEIINKATGAFDGLAGSITKIIGVVAIFKMGSKLFNKFKQPIMDFFLKDIVEYAGQSGEKSMVAFREGQERAKTGESVSDKPVSEKPLPKGYFRDANGRVRNSKGQFVSKEEEEQIMAPTTMDKIKDKTGYTAFSNGVSTLWKNRGAKEKLSEKKTDLLGKKKAEQGKLDDAKSRLSEAKKGGADEESIKGLNAEVSAARKNVKAFDKELEACAEEEKKLLEDTAGAWDQVGQGIGQAGQAITGVGMGLSLLGGILSTLGLDELGEGLTVVGAVITMIGGALSAIPPILTAITAHPIILVITAIIAVIVGLGVAIYQAFTASTRALEEAAKATEEAKKAADEAKDAYDNMLSDRNKYDELQKTLEDLTYGTREWKQALIEANQQVLELIRTYPELAQYISRGKDGQLTIKYEGWDNVIEQQAEAVSNSQALLGTRQVDEAKLKLKNTKEDFTTAAQVWRTSGDWSDVDTFATEAITEALEDMYFVQNSNIEEQTEQVDKLAKQYNVTTTQIKNAAKALSENKEEIAQIALEAENIARAQISAMASEKVNNSEYGQQVIDTFAESMVSDEYDSLVKERTDEIYKKNGSADSKNNEEFKALAKEYGVSAEMTGADKHDLQELYKAMAGVEEVPDGIKDSKDELAKAIAQMDMARKSQDKMDEYITRLEMLNTKDQNNIAGIFSQSGKGMSKQYADMLLNDDGTLNKEQLQKEAEKLGYKSIAEWADALNKTEEDLYDSAEKNARDALKARDQAFERINHRLAITVDGLDEANTKMDSFGKNAELSIAQEEALATKMLGVANASGEEGAIAVKQSLDLALDSVGDKADELAEYLEGMDWHDAGAWDELPVILESLGIVMTESVENFIKDAKELSNAIDIIDLNQLNQQLASVYATLKSIQSGEQKRAFTEDTYKQIISSNKDLANSFIQIGDTYEYVGADMVALTEALERNTIALLDQTTNQLDLQIGLANILHNAEKSDGEKFTDFTGKELSLYDLQKQADFTKIDYLEQFVVKVAEQYGPQGIDPLKYLDYNGQSLGLSYDTNFAGMNEEELNKVIQSLVELYGDRINLEEEYTRKLKESKIATYTLNDSAENVENIQTKRGAGDQEWMDYSRALSIQASRSGLIAEAVLSEYNALITKAEDETQTLTEEEIARLGQLEESMNSRLELIAENQQAQEALASLQSKVADAIYTTRQKEIDKLSDINQSVQSASGAMISKIQEQISLARQQRDNEQAKENIADLRSQQAAMLMDTSGLYDLQTSELDKEIAEAEQNYQDTLIDQALQRLSDANEKAAQQREEQINLLQSQLDYAKESGQIAQEAAAITNDSLAQVNEGAPFESTTGGQLIKTANAWETSAPEQYKLDMAALEKEAATAAATQIGTKVDTNASTVSSNITGGTGDDATSIGKIAEILTENKNEKDRRAESVADMVQEAKDVGITGGLSQLENNAKYQEEKAKYIQNGGTEANFREAVLAKIASQGGLSRGTVNDVSVSKEDKTATKYDDKNTVDKVKVTLDGTDYNVEFRNYGSSDSVEAFDGNATDEQKGTLGYLITRARGNYDSDGNLIYPSDKDLVAYDNKIYMFRQVGDKGWYLPLKTEAEDGETFKEAYFKAMNAYKTGGLADFTGPAWLDGTKSKPEIVLNQRDSANFIQLRDILSDALHNTSNSEGSRKSSGDNYYDIDVNVDKLESDYDVEKIADKIRRMIYDDASYRNVHAVATMR